MDQKTLLDGLLRNDEVLSRTVKNGTTDTTASTLKMPSKLIGPNLAKAVRMNREAVVDYILGCPQAVIKSRNDLLASVLTIGSLTTKHMLPAGLFRTWPLPADRKFGAGKDSKEISPLEIWDSLSTVCQHTVDRIASGEPPIKIAAAIEWQIGVGPLHPFYDACGRVSRSTSALVLRASGLPLKQHRCRSEYFEAGSSGVDCFAAYYATLNDIPL